MVGERFGVPDGTQAIVSGNAAVIGPLMRSITVSNRRERARTNGISQGTSLDHRLEEYDPADRTKRDPDEFDEHPAEEAGSTLRMMYSVMTSDVTSNPLSAKTPSGPIAANNAVLR